MNVGIDQLSFYTSSYVLDLSELALANGYSKDHYWQQLKQQKMAVLPPSEDWLTMAANALARMLGDNNNVTPINWEQQREIWRQQLHQVGLLLFATESSQEMSKASASYLHHWFAFPDRCRIVELKQACYAGTVGLQLALDWLRQHPNQQAVLVASDVADYQPGSPAESSQGCGAVAMRLSRDPAMLTIEPASAYCSKHSWDFWHPNYLPYALVDGKQSCEIYLKLLEQCWQQFVNLLGHQWHEYHYFCYHSPVPKLVYLAHRRIAKLQGIKLDSTDLTNALQPTLHYTQQIGNCYTASLYLNLLSLWETAIDLKVGDKIALYSYGSGSIGELFSGQFNCIPSNHRTVLQPLLSNRIELTWSQYRHWSEQRYRRETSNWQLDDQIEWLGGRFRLQTIQQGKRRYSFETESL